jgi:large subunit ribosomal protein L32e
MVMPGSKHRFKRQESWRYVRVYEDWRRPRGVTSRMRKEKKGWPARVKVGYGTGRAVKGMHPRGFVEKLVEREGDLDGLDPKVHIVRLSRRLGERKKLVFLAKAKELNLHVANPGKEEARPTEEVPPELSEKAGAEEVREVSEEAGAATEEGPVEEKP